MLLILEQVVIQIKTVKVLLEIFLKSTFQPVLFSLWCAITAWLSIIIIWKKCFAMSQRSSYCFISGASSWYQETGSVRPDSDEGRQCAHQLLTRLQVAQSTRSGGWIWEAHDEAGSTNVHQILLQTLANNSIIYLFIYCHLKKKKTATTLLWLQIDLRFEARNMEKFKNNFKDLEYVKFPTPLRPFVTRTVLVETYEVGKFLVIYVSRWLVCVRHVRFTCLFVCFCFLGEWTHFELPSIWGFCGCEAENCPHGGGHAAENGVRIKRAHAHNTVFAY